MPMATWHVIDVLPHLAHDSTLHAMDEISYAILTDMDCLGSNDDDQLQRVPFFKELDIDTTLRYRLCTFSSAGEPRWNMCTCNTEGGAGFAPLWQHRAVVCSGILRACLASTLLM